MRDLDKALADITAIRSQMAREAQFLGYGPVTLAATGVLAVLAAIAQALWLPDPAASPAAYLALWLATAAICAGLIAIETVTRSRRLHSGMAETMIWAAVEQFMPAAAAGALVAGVLLQFAPESLWMLPGLWQIVFALGVFASSRVLPRAVFAVGVWYLVTGLACLAYAQDASAFSPWAMALPYGVGQLMLALLVQRHAV